MSDEVKKTWEDRCCDLAEISYPNPNADFGDRIGFRNGFVAGRKDAINEAQVLVEALNRYKGLCVHWNENHHETCGRPADEALSAWREKTGDG